MVFYNLVGTFVLYSMCISLFYSGTNMVPLPLFADNLMEM